MGGVARQTVAKLVAKHKDAVNSDGAIDTHHEAIVAWLKKRGFDAEAPPAQEKKQLIDEERYVDNMRERTIRDIEDGVGSVPEFEKILKLLEQRDKVKLKRLDVEERSGNLVPRVMVERGVFTLIEDLLTRLTVDAPTTLANKIRKLTGTDTSSEIIRKEIHDVISRHIKGAKKQATDAINNL